jgi:NADH-quinone oxidoreductase subunit F
MSKNLSELSGRKGVVDNLFEKMGEAAQKTGSPDSKSLDQLAEEFLIGKSSTYGAASFYDFMKEDNKGKKIYVCNGSACLCAGTQKAVQNALRETFKDSEIGHMTCLGRCHENAAFHYNGKNYSAKSKAEIKSILKGSSSEADNYFVFAENPVLTKSISDAQICQDLKNALDKDSKDLLAEIKISGVRGRGGAGFPMHLKLQACANEQETTKFIICNADEGDPGAFSDRYLMEKQSLKVLFGMIISGFITGAEWGILYIRAEYPESIEIVQQKIDLLRDMQLIGKNINNNGFNFDLKIIKAQGAYICGEETALINSIEGQRPEVRTRPPYPTQQGLFNKPTVVNNVETLAAVYPIILSGGAAYQNLGTEKSNGTKLISLDSHFNKPGLYEVEMGTSLNELVYNFAGGFKSKVKALHIGGPLGGIVPVQRIKDLNIDFESFSQNGFLLGHASVVSIPEDFPMIQYLEHLFDFAAYESCGKCFPCRLGTTRAYELLKKANNESYKISKTLFDDLLSTLEQGSLCAHGGGIPLPVRNALLYFKEELENYFE